MDILAKYYKFRPQIKDGDLILFRGTKLLAKLIQNCDKAYFNHIGIAMRAHDGLFIVDSQSTGVEADRLSERILDYRNGDFCIIQSLDDENLDEEMKKLFAREDRDGILYDYENGFKELMNRKFGWNLKVTKNDKKDICSDFVYEYALRRKMILPFENRVAFPMDYIRHRNTSETIILGY